MGVDRQDYIMYGWKLPYDLKNADGEDIDVYDLYEEVEDEGFSLISDGMCGSYNVFGIVINDGGDQYEGWDFVELDIKPIDAGRAKAKLKEIIGENSFGEPKLFIFSHFS